MLYLLEHRIEYFLLPVYYIGFIVHSQLNFQLFNQDTTYICCSLVLGLILSHIATMITGALLLYVFKLYYPEYTIDNL